VSALDRSVGNRTTRREPNFPPMIPVLCAGLVWATAITSKDKGRLAEI
jgi:hypothetical protein